jgi:uncharacterized membrane protein YeaQ/YmgE (transglycosylase-associated protein family)
MNLIVWLITGAAIGWMAHLAVKSATRQGLVMDVLAGAVGAFTGGYFFAPMLGTLVDAQAFSVTSFVVAVVGAVVLLIVSRMLRQAAAQ